MGENDWLAERFEGQRPHLQAVAYRMLGSLSEAEDAVQEAWLRLSRTDISDIQNLGGWLTTVVARVCLDMLRARKSRREEPLDAQAPGLDVGRRGGPVPEQEALLADSLGLALLVLLEALAPAERIAFVLHDLFAVPFDEIATIVGRSPTAARQLASRARRRVRGVDKAPGAVDAAAGRLRQREVVEAFLAASRQGDFAALLTLLDPDVILHADRAAAPPGAARVTRGAAAVAVQAHSYARRARFGRLALVNGALGIVVDQPGRPRVVLAFQFAGWRIAGMDVIADPQRLGRLELAELEE